MALLNMRLKSAFSLFPSAYAGHTEQ